MRRPTPHGREPRRADRRLFHHTIIFPVKPRAPSLPPPTPSPTILGLSEHPKASGGSQIPPGKKSAGICAQQRQCCTRTRPDSGSSVRSWCPRIPAAAAARIRRSQIQEGAFAPPPPSSLPGGGRGRRVESDAPGSPAEDRCEISF
ncbi:hypothetical protein PVAP13_9KG201685 [Panicum virgatum]|uniref:Uncharacterized protein n=1 Tax=Panicum virgatum TaxID=38727 RepID=A0A8T0NHY7_PANVG|nr:hypothetical protein PVAP13_9KG201685 [Panicum virgatum]